MSKSIIGLHHLTRHLPQPGHWSTIKKFLEHVGKTKNLFGENMYEFLLDYLQILYLNPKQRLPVLCLVSKERPAGKTTFLEFLRIIFGDNTTILDNEQFLQGRYTSHYADKLIICIDGAFVDNEHHAFKKRLKSLSTAKTLIFEAKGSEALEIPNLTHIILTSNDENNFISVDEEENRYCVLKLDSLKKPVQDGNIINEDIPEILKRMQSEVPAFLHFLQNRQLHYEPNKSRLSFAPEIYFTEHLNIVSKIRQIPTKNTFEESKETQSRERG